MRTLPNFSLKSLNSFGFDISAEEYIAVESSDVLRQAIDYATSKSIPWYVIGGGSNLVIHENLPGLTIHVHIMGKKLVTKTSSHALVDVGAGENWHEFVQWTLDNDLPGLENLALIPGTCGAAPIQNIGAYGSEIGQFIDSIEVLDTHQEDDELMWQTLTKADCQFKYRHSLFKDHPGRYIVTQVRLAIPLEWRPNLQYAELAKHISNISPLLPIDIFEAVCQIRQAKLPDPKVLGNAGSFFHNPVVDESTYLSLKEKFPNLVSFPSQTINGQAQFKLAAGWLIDQCGFKGYRQGDIGVYDKQALVLVNHGHGNGKELLQLATLIQEKIHAVYGVDLTQEPINLPTS